MMEKELKPCPFCGEDLIPRVDHWVHPSNDCFLAHADFETGNIYVYDDEEEAWNRRAEDGK